MDAKTARNMADAANATEAANEYKGIIDTIKKTAAEGGSTIVVKGLKQGDGVCKLLTNDGYGVKWAPQPGGNGPELTVRW